MGNNSIEDYNFIAKIKNLPFVEQIILFGSRARKDNEAKADIDIAISCPNASEAEWLKIAEIMGEADTLLKIDYVRLDKLSSDSPLKRNIINEGKILYDKN